MLSPTHSCTAFRTGATRPPAALHDDIDRARVNLLAPWCEAVGRCVAHRHGMRSSHRSRIEPFPLPAGPSTAEPVAADDEASVAVNGTNRRRAPTRQVSSSRNGGEVVRPGDGRDCVARHRSVGASSVP